MAGIGGSHENLSRQTCRIDGVTTALSGFFAVRDLDCGGGERYEPPQNPVQQNAQSGRISL